MTTLATPSIRSRALARLLEGGFVIIPDACQSDADEDCARGWISGLSIGRLRDDPRFHRPDVRSPYHEEMGPNRLEWRETRATKSCQVIVDPDTYRLIDGTMYYRFYADEDKFNPDAGAGPALLHGAAEVLPDDGPKLAARIWRWLRGVFSALALVLLAAESVSAQTWLDRATPPAPTAAARRVADVVSWVTVSTSVALDVRESWRAPNRARAFERQALRLGVTWGAAELVKRLVHRSRPCAPSCGLDSPSSSFYSLHTAFAFQALGGARVSVSVPLAIGTGGLRVAAGKHYATDVLAGAAAGLLASRIR